MVHQTRSLDVLILYFIYIEARERSESFFPWFSKEKKALDVCVCDSGMFVCVIQHRKWPLRSTYSTHTAPMPVLTGSVHAHILTKPSRAGFAVIRLELIEPGAATCV